jgi:hypothetical protein
MRTTGRIMIFLPTLPRRSRQRARALRCRLGNLITSPIPVLSPREPVVATTQTGTNPAGFRVGLS